MHLYAPKCTVYMLSMMHFPSVITRLRSQSSGEVMFDKLHRTYQNKPGRRLGLVFTHFDKQHHFYPTRVLYDLYAQYPDSHR